MNLFSDLVAMLEGETEPEARSQLLAHYLRKVPKKDACAALSILLDNAGKQPGLTRTITELTDRFIDKYQYERAERYVGDKIEVLALIWPVAERNAASPAPHLNEVMTRLSEGGALIDRLPPILNELTAGERHIFMKIVAGRLKPGLQPTEIRRAIAMRTGQPVHRIHSVWPELRRNIPKLLAGTESGGSSPDIATVPGFLPFAVTRKVPTDSSPPDDYSDYIADWAWDGERVHLAARNGILRLYRSNGDDIAPQFPEIQDMALRNMHVEAVMSALPPGRVGKTASGADILQRRFAASRNLENLSRDFPVRLRLTDILRVEKDSLFETGAEARRRYLESWFQQQGAGNVHITCPPKLSLREEGSLPRLISDPADGAVGVRLRHVYASYEDPQDLWFRPRRHIRAAVLYAEMTGAEGDALLTVAAGSESGLIPIGKASAHLPAPETARLFQYIKAHTEEKFGPVRQLVQGDAGLKAVISFDSVHPATRRKSGLTLRDLQIENIDWPSTRGEIATLADLQQVLLSK